LSGRDFLRRHVFHNLTLKITSLVLATGLWLAVSSSPPSEVVLNTAIIFRNMPQNLEISSVNIPSVQVRVRGPERRVRRLQATDVYAEVDVSGVTPGEHTFDLTKAIGVPDKLEISQVVPSEIHVVLDTRVMRWVPVHPRVIGTFPAGYRIGRITVDPEKVELVGPKKEIDAVESATTDPVDVSGVLESITVARPAYVSDPLVQVRDSTPVHVTITMQKQEALSQSKPK
jgi:YbbR domain-containing protein